MSRYGPLFTGVSMSRYGPLDLPTLENFTTGGVQRRLRSGTLGSWRIYLHSEKHETVAGL